MCPSTLLPLRAKYLAPSAVMAPVRIAVMDVALMIANGTPVDGLNSASKPISEGNPDLVVLDEVADYLDSREVERVHDSAQHIEMPHGRIMRYQVNARFDDHCAPSLCIERRLDGVENFGIGERCSLDVRPVEILQMDLLQSSQSP